MKTVNKYKKTLLEWFYLDEDDMTVKRAKNGYRGRYYKDDIVCPYILCSHGYGVHVPKTRTTVPYHHLLTLLRGIEIPDDAVIDHLDGNVFNNERNNIRVTTQSINCRNSKRKKNNTTGLTGVNWNKSSNSYVVRKQIGTKRKYLGHRKTLLEAKELLNSYKEILSLEEYTDRHGKESSTTIEQVSKDTLSRVGQ